MLIEMCHWRLAANPRDRTGLLPEEFWCTAFSLKAGSRTSSEVAVDVHAFVQNTHDVDDAFGIHPIEQNV
jgi:hypothetical protein